MISSPKALFDATTLECSKLITQRYSTSFTLGIRTLHPRFHESIYAIYGFVRFADEIVDTFHAHDRAGLLERFKQETYRALEEKISLNPVLHAFQMVVHRYQIDVAFIDAFLHSMEMDLLDQRYNCDLYDEYIYGSAEVVGLMCLRVFCEGDQAMFDRLQPAACALGAAFQKVNFLRDIQSDFQDRGRVYFPEVDFRSFCNQDKEEIEANIQQDFDKAYQGILALPRGARMGVYLAYIYYLKLFKKIKQLPAAQILVERVRVPDNTKLALLLSSYIRYQFNTI
ncbi:phytoene/squalene synthase family protein [Rufibacter glacialis]|uniref:Phytoene/squalene synthase family protein n=1 Tax=Rufibacter glacialis TaxID=1259555 RepID=A0A5M8QB60_9BACT|nr:phytoene/squalene synthase family protein [Rufibacter glacialis]KAA6432281.1 phytoene/squalene synthase family protein [Rufibacter glacialis]GGK77387.1 phytoene synthase [Rufibacter glacialis]